MPVSSSTTVCPTSTPSITNWIDPVGVEMLGACTAAVACNATNSGLDGAAEKVRVVSVTAALTSTGSAPVLPVKLVESLV